MKILSWNVAGLRARLKTKEGYSNDLERVIFALPNNNGYEYFDIVCLQETKCTSEQAKLTPEITTRYPYMIWNNSLGTTQRKGFSGTTIWSTKKPVNILNHYNFDEEGRTIALEFDDFVLINVYVPNSQKVESERAEFRTLWDIKFREITHKIKEELEKPIIICGDLNVARTNNDIVDPNRKLNRVPGFLDDERHGIEHHLKYLDLIDVYRQRNPETRVSTYWSNFLKQPRSNINGWRIDYFLTSKNIFDKIDNVEILQNTIGSDHCPIYINIIL
tara:strand:- start:3220 stop:4044 length:825 start_codon:yes stop_codon:yes gene_type:complete